MSIKVIAYRVEGADGWRITETDNSIDAFRQALSVSGEEVTDVEELIFGAHRLKAGEDYAPPATVRYRVHTFGWTFDEKAQCWRGPGESLEPLPGVPDTVSSFSVEYGETDSGWLPVRIQADGHAVEFNSAAIYDPFDELVAWLEFLVEGRYPHMAFDVEGCAYEFLTFPAKSAVDIRFVVTDTVDFTPGLPYREVCLNVSLNRRRLVSEIYERLREYGASPEFDPYEWTDIPIYEELQKLLPRRGKTRLASLPASELNDILARYFPDIRTIDCITADQIQREALRTEELVDGITEPLSGSGEECPTPEFVVPEEFDTWSLESRDGYLRNLLSESVAYWHGTDIRKLRSEKVETWLAGTR